MAGKWPNKDPLDVLDYSIDWANLFASGETISTVSWDVETGVTLDSQSNTDTVATAWLSSGTIGEDYTVSCTVTTTAGRTFNRSATLAVRDR